MLKRTCIGAFAALGLILLVAGCGAQPGKTTVTWGKGKTPPPMATAPKAGTYALYPNNGVNPIWSGQLREGDQYGFHKRDDGKVVGVAGNQDNIPLEATMATGFMWKMQDRAK